MPDTARYENPETAGAARQGPSSARVRVRTLVLSRWLAVGGQIITLLVISEGLEAKLPMTAAVLAVAASAALNVFIQLRRGLNGWHSEREAAFYLGYDICQLSLLLSITGGLANPFAVLILAPVTISATVLNLVSTLTLSALAFIAITFLGFLHLPLPWPAEEFQLPALYLQAIWVALTICMAFLMFYAHRVAEEARRMSDALAATHLALAREQELSSLGGLAAAAAHELGTPLGTIALISKELSHDLPDSFEMSDDIDLLNSEVARCREILARLSANRLVSDDPNLHLLRLTVLALAVSESHGRAEVAVNVSAADENLGEEPLVMRSAELLQGLGNFLDNASEFARTKVDVVASWNEETVSLEIADDGPGFSASVFEMLGNPYVTTRHARGGMGLGVFISKTLLERTGAQVSFHNRRGGAGARVMILWPRGAIEEVVIEEAAIDALSMRAEQ